MNKIFGQQKILNHLDKVNNWLKGDLNTLITAELDLTNNCNSNCPECAGKRTVDNSLKLDEAKSYIDQMIELGLKGLTLSGGGEPTISPIINDVLDYAHGKVEIALITNGIYLPKELMERILDYCVWCRFSLDAGDKEMYAKTHGISGDIFDKVCNNIKELTDMKQKRNSQCTIGTGYLTNKDRIKGMENYVIVSKKLNVSYAQFRPMHWDYTDITEIYETLKEYYNTDTFSVLCSIQKYKRFHDIIKRPYDACYGVNFIPIIAVDHNVYVCCHHRGNPKCSLGSLKEKTFKELWSNRQTVFDNIDLSKCIPFCRSDEFNRLLYEIKKPKNHINFL